MLEKQDRQEATGISLDKTTRKKIDDYAISHGLSRSAVIRLAVNEFFLKMDGN